MNHCFPAFFSLAVLAVSPLNAEVLPPSPVRIESSTDGRFLVRLDLTIQLFTLSTDEKNYRFTTEIVPLGHAIKALVSKDGSYVIAFEYVESSKTEKGGDLVCVYSSSGERISKWRLDEIILRDDLDGYPPDERETHWWTCEVGIGGRPEEVFIAGPVDGVRVIERRHCYVMNLKTRVWSKAWDQVLSKKAETERSVSP